MSLVSERINAHKRQIVLAHGGGGQLTDELVRDLVLPRLNNVALAPLGDAAVLSLGGARLAFTTDSSVVHPLEFPGGDIGRLAVSGTVNDLAVSGAEARWLSLGLILEEGLSTNVLKRVLDSIAATAAEAGVEVATGDTKVVARGQADGLYINTAGVGVMRAGLQLGFEFVQPGDVVLLSGTIADHGMAVMLQREDQSSLRSRLESDVGPINGLVGILIEAAPDVRFMRDPTRGGLAGVLSDLAERTGCRVEVDEELIPMRKPTLYACEMLGIDPLDVANEGKVVAVVPPGQAESAIQAMRSHERGREASAIGRIGQERDGLCVLTTDVGGQRVIQKPYGEQLPRIC
ncbi:MAG: hydrogenase expression/formation protein HypE [Leptolyngbya sp. PLA3]|nr:MAG: hydrogenase expression/formation protein HypE [Cyanobacteria bacterium CYA]MCE7967770.1 hydrogenase expression/formation protein HypE [Leptolyngbya sp. PL-A3]